MYSPLEADEGAVAEPSPTGGAVSPRIRGPNGVRNCIGTVAVLGRPGRANASGGGGIDEIVK